MDAELATRPDFESPLLAVENFRAAGPLRSRPAERWKGLFDGWRLL